MEADDEKQQEEEGAGEKLGRFHDVVILTCKSTHFLFILNGVFRRHVGGGLFVYSLLLQQGDNGLFQLAFVEVGHYAILLSVV